MAEIGLSEGVSVVFAYCVIWVEKSMAPPIKNTVFLKHQIIHKDFYGVTSCDIMTKAKDHGGNYCRSRTFEFF